MSGTLDRFRAIREKRAARKQARRATRGERELRRAEARRVRRAHKTFDEGRRDPRHEPPTGGTGGF
jgi:hypothetical protein